MSKLILWGAFLVINQITNVYGQHLSYNSLPDILKTNSNMVVREFTREIELKPGNKGVERVRKVLTVLDKKGENMAFLAIPYDKNSTVSIKQIVIYDSDGKKNKSIKMSEIEDSPLFSSFELYSDDRFKYYKPMQAVYPYTIVYEYEMDLNNIISFGRWSPFNNYNVSAEYVSLTVIHPESIRINRKEVNIKKKSSEVLKNVVTETWELVNFPAIEAEPYSVSLAERLPSVYLTPEKLSFYSYEGSSASWNEYGKWMHSLYADRDELTEAEKTKIDIILQGITDTVERIKCLYKHMQENTRYVAVTLEAGGFQPFDVKTVLETGYGDCKALTNYMYSLLKYIGVKSYPSLVASGSYKVPVFKDFPNFQQFNHVILCIPGYNDTIWLECTNQKSPFGFLGNFTDDRDVLLITEYGGKFAHTTKYGSDDNLRLSKSVFNIGSEGSASCTTEILLRGLQYENHSGFLNSNYDEQKKWLYDNSTLPSLEILDFSTKVNKTSIPDLKINESLSSKNYCSFSGPYMLLPLNRLNVQTPIQKMLITRYSDILINRSYVDHDTIIYNIPKNRTIESLPSGINITSNFGSYSTSIAINGNTIVYIRRYTLNEGRYKPEDYKDLYEFILAVSKADNTKVILTKEL